MTQATLWMVTAAATWIAIVAGVLEWRQAQRRDLDRIGLIPWGTLSLIGFVVAVVGLGLGLRS